MKTAKVLYGATDFGSPHFSSDLLWKTGFRAPDPFFLVDNGARSWLFASPLEIGRARREAHADRVMTLKKFLKPGETSVEGLIRFLRAQKISEVVLPHPFPYSVARMLGDIFVVRDAGYALYPERARKKRKEIAEIMTSQRACENAVSSAVSFLKKCGIKKGKIYDGGRVVTSEMVRRIIDDALWKSGCLGSGTIVSSGIAAADPHRMGSGPILPHQPIVMDVFPVSMGAHYYADMTRTFFKGQPSPDHIRMYEAVRKAQEVGVAAVRAGADGAKIHTAVKEYLESQNYPTDTKQIPAEGFIHGLGHGVGIDIHEPPHLGVRHEILEEGNVVTVEPGLYYHRARRGIPIGGIRLEDMVLVTKNGCRNLTRFPKNLASVIIP